MRTVTLSRRRPIAPYLALLCCIAAQCALPASGACQNAALPAPAVASLDQDARLDRLITVDATGIALKDLLRKYSVPDLTLTAHRLCAEQKLQVHLQKRPLRTLMTSLANLLAGNWTASDDRKGYEFTQSDGALLRRRRWWLLFQGEHDRTIAARREAALAAMGAPHREPAKVAAGGEPDNTPPEERERMRTADIAVHNVFALLPADVREQLVQQIDGALYTQALIHEDSLSKGGEIAIPMADLPPPVADIVPHALRPVPGTNEAVPAYLLLRASDNSLTATLVNAAGQQNEVGSINLPSESLEVLALDQSRFARQVKRLGRNAPPEWKELAAFQNSTVWKNDVPADFHEDIRLRKQRSQMLSWLARTANIEFVADYYSRPFTRWAADDDAQPLKRPLKAELDYQAAAQDMSWKRQTADQVYLFRDNRWYRNDELEVPNALLQRWLRQWAEIDAEQPDPPSYTAPIPAAFARRVLDLWADMCSNLTLFQLNNGFQYAAIGQESQEPTGIQFEYKPMMGETTTPKLQFPFCNLADLLMDDRNILRFYAGLSGEERDQLLTGKLSYGDLSQSNQRMAVYMQPLLPLLAPQANQANQPVLLGLVSPGGEGHGGLSWSAWESRWPNRTRISYPRLETTSPFVFPAANTRLIQ